MITSPHNDKLKEIRRLQRRHGARFVAEGEDLVEAAARAGWPPVYRLEAGVDVEPGLLDDVSALGSGTRVVAVYECRWSVPTGPLCVALWGVRDPGNVGTVLRSAHAFGAASVALGPDCADPFGPRAVRASMGAIFALPIARVDDPAELPGRRIGLAARAGTPLAEIFLVAPLGEAASEAATSEEAASEAATSILVGAERTGLPADVLAACDAVAHIPIATESLNAAMAATVALYEATRGAAGAPPPAEATRGAAGAPSPGEATRGAASAAPPAVHARIARVGPS